jgi:hypothetical protein
MKNKLAQVIMLPTATEPYKMPYNEHIPEGAIIKTLMWGVRTKGVVGELIVNEGQSISNYSKEMYQHLYFTTDEEIEEGNWCYDAKSNAIHKCINIYPTGAIEINGLGGALNPKFARKIVATTDKLEISKYQPQFTVDKTPITKYLPQPPQAFIEKYCKEGGIDEVMIEYIEYEQFDGSLLPGHTYPKELKLKVDSDNTITIVPAKDSWNKEELIDEITRALHNYKALCTEYPDGTVKAVDKEELEKLLSNPDITFLL